MDNNLRNIRQEIPKKIDLKKVITFQINNLLQ